MNEIQILPRFMNSGGRMITQYQIRSNSNTVFLCIMNINRRFMKLNKILFSLEILLIQFAVGLHIAITKPYGTDIANYINNVEWPTAVDCIYSCDSKMVRRDIMKNKKKRTDIHIKYLIILKGILLKLRIFISFLDYVMLLVAKDI